MAPKRKELTRMPCPDRSTERWRKIYRGQVYYFLGDYDEALKAWHAKQAAMEAEEEAKEQEGKSWYRRRWEQVIEWHRQQGLYEGAEKTAQEMATYDDDGLERCWKNMTDREKGEWSERIRQMEEKPAHEPHTVGQAVESFLTKQAVRVQAGEISAGYYDGLQRALNHFLEHIGRRVAVNNITSHALESYHSSLLARVGKDWSPDYAAGMIRMCKTFVSWCYDCDLLHELPRILRRGSKAMTIATGRKKKPVFTNEEVKVLLDNASERTQLYLLLMANTGFTQIDIASLRPDEVNWKEGRITRKRSKTESNENVPVVSYPLWKRTFALLEKFGKRKGACVLVNENGGELKREVLREDDRRYSKCDNIATAYGRLVRKLKKGKLLKSVKPLKTFRKTSPSRLEDSEYASCSRWFGGWSPRSVADKHYIQPPQNLFDRAVKWLEKSYGLDEHK